MHSISLSKPKHEIQSNWSSGLPSRYHVKEHREPKGILKLSELNVAFAPQKIGHHNSLQITFLKDGTTRHIYVHHDDPEVINCW